MRRLRKSGEGTRVPVGGCREFDRMASEGGAQTIAGEVECAVSVLRTID